MKLFFIASVLTLTRAQFTEEPIERWTGPFADHKLGIHPFDTAEVAQAKTQHLTAYKQVLTVLPELPPEERYIKTGLPLPAILALQKSAQQEILKSQFQQPLVPVVTSTVPTILAEEIPRSPTGEVPEVYAARLAHLKALEEVLAVIPELPPEERYQENPAQQTQQQPQYVVPQYPIHPQLSAVPPTIKTFSEEISRSPIGEVPEVHAARPAHLKAYKEAAATLPRLVDIPAQHHQIPVTPNWVYQVPVTTTTQNPGLVYQQYLVHQQQAVGHVVQDTPEVARAKAEHAAAVAAALG